MAGDASKGELQAVIQLVCGDALTYSADVLVLKHAQAFYGFDLVVAKLLSGGDLPRPDLAVAAWRFRFAESIGTSVASKSILFVGVPPLTEFSYREIERLASFSLGVIRSERPAAKEVVFTLHGPGFGLDEVESFAALLRGLREALYTGAHPSALRKVTIIERDERRVQRLRASSAVLDLQGPCDEEKVPASATIWTSPMSGDPLNKPTPVGRNEKKPYAFVAMPYDATFDDLFHYGIQNAVHASGYLCERVDLVAFTGDVLERVKKRIEGAELVIADLTGSNPNVYLEIGYAWGCGRPTVLVMNEKSEAKFDVQGQRYLKYRNIQHLEDVLKTEIAALRANLQ